MEAVAVERTRMGEEESAGAGSRVVEGFVMISISLELPILAHTLHALLRQTRKREEARSGNGNFPFPLRRDT